MSRLRKLDRAVMELRGQLTVLGVVLVGGLTLAIVIATQRNFAERFIREKYEFADAEVPERVRQAADAVAAGEFDEASFARVNHQLQRQLYDDWINCPGGASPNLPSELMRLKPSAYSRFAEKTVVCGDAEQRRRAVSFLAQSQSKSAGGVYQRLAVWAKRRNLVDLAESIDDALRDLKRQSS